MQERTRTGRIVLPMALLGTLVGCAVNPVPTPGADERDKKAVESDAGLDAAVSDASFSADAGSATDTGGVNDTGGAADAGATADTSASMDAHTGSPCGVVPSWPTIAALETLHVKATGDDKAGDGTESKPFATMQRAAKAAKPGTHIVVHPGTYKGGISIHDLRGTKAAPIRLGGIKGKTRPVIGGGNTALHLIRPRWLVLHDLEVRKAKLNGINCDDGAKYSDPEAARHLRFERLDIHDVGSGGNHDCLKLSGLNDYTVVDCSFRACGGGGQGSGVDHVGCHRGIIARNRFESMDGTAVQCKGGSDDIEVRWNTFVNAGARGVNMGGSTGAAFFRPPIAAMAKSGKPFEARNIRVIANSFKGSQTPFAFVGCVDCIAVHNQVVDPGKWSLRILQETKKLGGFDFATVAKGLFANNLIVFKRAQVKTDVNIGPNTDAPSFSFRNNLWFASDKPGQSAPKLPAKETGAVIGKDPKLKPGKGIDASSPAVGKGAAIGPKMMMAGLSGDMAGTCYADPPSIGAFEP